MSTQDKAPGLVQLLGRMSRRDRVYQRTGEYLASHGVTAGAAGRASRYADVVNGYFDLSTDFYEFGWGQSFHFAQQAKGENFRDAIIRHERRLVDTLQLRPQMTVLDVGCGVGGPMRNIARMSGCSVVGINNNTYQVTRAGLANADADLSGRCSVVPGDFMAMAFPNSSFDAAYAIEATVHAPDWTGVFREANRCLKPGGGFALYDWCMTDRYDDGNSFHRDLKQRIIEGNGLVDIGTSQQLIAAVRAAGFEIIEHRDAASDGGEPWYQPLAQSGLSLSSFRASVFGRKLTRAALQTMELLRLAPGGAADMVTFLDKAAVALVDSGRAGVFTPMYFVHARKRD